MSDNAASVPELQARLHHIAQLLRASQPIDADSRQKLAELVDELGDALRSGQLPVAEAALLTETTAHLAESLHQTPTPTQRDTVRDRVEEAVVGLEARAPFAAGLAHRLLDMLTNLGI